MAQITLTGWINKFLKKLNTLTSDEKTEARTLIDAASHTDTVAALATKQATLVSGTNIKTIGGVSVLGSGNLTPAAIGAAPVSSPTFSGSPTVPTAAEGDDSALIANTAFVQREIQSGGGHASYPHVDPNVPHKILVSLDGENSSYELTRTTDVDGQPRWTNGSNSVRYYLDLPVEGTDLGGWQINIPGIFVAELADVGNPWDAGTWVISVGAPLGQPLVNNAGNYDGGVATPRYTDEVIRVTGTDPDTFWKWNGSAWVDISI